jgi:ABC-type enterochelin transport system ATPase subunit
MRIPIEGTKYSRDLNNRAVICHDISVARKYNDELIKLKENDRRDQEINSLKDEIFELKSMIKVLMDRG